MVTPISPDLDGDGSITSKEWYDYITNRTDLQNKDDLQLVNTNLSGSLKDIQKALSELPAWAGNLSPADQAGKQFNIVKAELDALLELIKAEQANEQINQQKLEQLQGHLRQQLTLAQKLFKGFDINPYKQAAGLNSGNFKASVTSSNRTPYSGNLPSGPKAQGVGEGTSFFPPAGWGKAQTAAPYFNSSAYLQSMAMEDNIMSTWDSINKNTNRGKQLMMLFFYFARMAESGDMGAMYQFMKFITYIISKDKAKQQIEMGKKLIQLQELSRKWTSKLLNVQSNSADPAASNELMKTMTIVKSETDAIATSQKLISQMMEEFAQVVESLTNSTKAALDAHGRILRTVSRVG